MRLSQYTILAAYNDATLAFNTLTDEFLRIAVPLEEFHSQLAEERFPSHVRAVLEQGRFIVPNSHDEFHDYLILNRQRRFGPQWLVLFLSPTLKCNASCEYCYQRHVTPSHADNKTENGPNIPKLVAFLAPKLLDAQGLRIFWYGGEPLLRKGYIERTSAALQLLAKEAEKPYSAFMVTNGLLLDNEAVSCIQQANITFLQVSLDGTEEVHDRIGRRDKERGFRTIINNLRNLPHNINIGLRLNVSRANLAVIPDLIEELAAAGLNRPNVRLSMPLVYPFAIDKNLHEEPIDERYIVSNESYSFLHLGLIAYAYKHGFNKDPEVILLPDKDICHALRSKGYSVWPDGSVTRCVHEISVEEKLTINDNHIDITHVQSLQRWLTTEIFAAEPCRSCFYLPQCGGGCLHSRFAGNNPPHICPSSKFNLQLRMQLYEAIKAGNPFPEVNGDMDIRRAILDFTENGALQ